MRLSKNKRWLSALLGACLISAAVSVAAFAEDGEGTTIKVFHTNDVHSRYDVSVEEDGSLSQFGYARLKSVIDENSIGADGRLIFDAGDVFHGQPFATLDRGISIAKLMRAVGYDAMVAGNHDFNYGAVRTPMLAQVAKLDLLGSNVVNKDGTPAKGFEPYKIYRVDDVKIGVFGLSTPETAYKTNPKNVEGIKFSDPVATAKKMVRLLREEKGADVVICLSHLGIDEASGKDTADYLASKVNGIDLIIDGHSHSAPDSYQNINNTVITSAGQYMEYIGMTTITVDSDKKVTIETAPLKASDYKADGLTADPAVQRTIDNIQASQKGKLGKVVAHTDEVLNGARGQVRTTETNLSRIITTAMLAETDADIALTNGGGIRASIDAGPITVGEVQTVLPFGNYIVTVNLSGKEVRQAVEHGLPGLVNGKLEEIGNNVQFAGLNVLYDPAKPKGSRVLSITHNGKPIQDTGSYLVATNDFMAAGGDGYTMLKKKIVNEFAALDEAVISYLNESSKEAIAEVQAEDRIQQAA